MLPKYLGPIIIILLLTPGSRGQEAIQISTQRLDKSGIIHYINVTDSINRYDRDGAAKRYVIAYQNSKAIHYSDGVIYSLLQLGKYYFDYRKDYERSAYYLNLALPFADCSDLKRIQLIPHVYNFLAGSYFHTGQQDSAMLFYIKALDFVDIHNLRIRNFVSTIYSNLGSVLSATRQYQQGARYIRRSVEIIEGKNNENRLNKGDSIILLSNFQNLGALYVNFISNIDSAEYWFAKATHIAKHSNDSARLQNIYANLSLAWLSDEQFYAAKACHYLDSAITYGPNHVSSNIRIQLALGRLYYFKGQFQKAINASQRAIALCENIGKEERKLLAYTTLAFSYAALGNIQQSMAYRKAFTVLSNQISNEDVTNAISSMEVQHRVAEKDKALAEQKARLYQQRYWLAGSVGGGGILLLALVGFVRNSRQKRRLERERIQNLERQQKIDQLQVERETEERERKRIAQELHDGLGVLLSAAKINQTMLARVVPGAEGAKPFNESKLILSQMQQEVEWITNNLVPDYITENGVESALHTLAAKFNRPGVFDIHLESYGGVRELHPDRAFSLYRALEEILHNAVKHSGGNQLDVQLMYHPDQLHISLEDNGKGFDTQLTYAGMGMQNIRNRIMGMGGVFELSSIPGKGTSYILQVPY